MMLILAVALAGSTQLDQCLNTGEAAKGVTPAMSACFVDDYKRADAKLNLVYKATMQRLPASRQASLRTSQRTWIWQRDHACPLNNDPGAGTIEALNHPGCLAKETRKRTLWLTKYR